MATKELQSRTDVEQYINQLPVLDEEVKNLKRKWSHFYFGWVSPLHICNVSKEDFLFYANKFSECKISAQDSSIVLQIGGNNKASLFLHTDIDFEFYEKYILKNVLKN